MADPYLRYRVSADTAIPDYISSAATTLSSRPLWPSSYNHLSSSSDFRQNDISAYEAYRDRAYGVDGIVGVGVRPESGYNSYTSEIEDRYLGRRHVLSGPGIPSIVNERPESLRKADGGPLGRGESNVLFVDALPSDCTRREVSHLFRPFHGFKEITVVHKEPRHSADKAMVLCFVEFTDSNHALTALEALQGYKFDNKKPDGPALRIHFARFPFQPPSDRDPPKLPSDRDPFQLRDTDPLKLPTDRDPFQLPDRDPLKLPTDRDLYQLPTDRGLYQLPSDREVRPPAISRERELAFQDEEVMGMMNRKFEGSPKRMYEGSPKRMYEGSPKRKFEGSPGSSKKGKVEASESNYEPRKERKWCIFEGCFRCGKQGHLGKDCTDKPRVCYGCGKHGHKHSDCPTTKNDYLKLKKKGKAGGGIGKKGNPPKTQGHG